MAKKKQNLEEITKTEFETGISGYCDKLKEEHERVVDLIRTANYYEDRGYIVKYYLDMDNGTYKVLYKKRDKIGFDLDTHEQ